MRRWTDGGLARRGLLWSLVGWGACALAAAQEGPPPALVVTETVVRRPIAERVSLIGSVRPRQDSLVASEVEGRVTVRAVEHGDRVAADTPLVHLDTTRLRRQLDRVEAELIDARAQLTLARIQEERARELFERGILARGEMDEAEARLVSNEGRVGSIEAQRAAIEHEISRTAIRSPFAGVVTEVHTEIGEWLARGSPVVRVVDLSSVEVRLEVPEHHFRRLRREAPVPVTVEALPGLTLDGRIYAVVPQADARARTFPLFVRAPNPGGQVGSGMLAGVELTLAGGDDALVVPKDAIVRQAQRELVWIVENGKVRGVSVRTGRGIGDRVEIIGAVSEGDTVVVRGNERLAPGQSVVVETAEAGPRAAEP